MSYITFANIGNSGNLGSQIQQYASLYAIAKETKKQLVFPKRSQVSEFGLKFAQALDIQLNIVDDDFVANFKPISPRDVVHDEAVFSLEDATNYNFTNVFHTYRYWYPKYGTDIYNLTWNSAYLQEAQSVRNQLPQDKELVSLHVRRGDYLLPQHHHFCNLDTDYYGKALEEYLEKIENYHFVIFSNDIEWCKESLIEGDNVSFINTGVDFTDLILMSLCDHNIIANSSFSWWAAFFNRNAGKKVTSPLNYIKNYSPFNFLNGNFQIPTWKKINNLA